MLKPSRSYWLLPSAHEKLRPQDNRDLLLLDEGCLNFNEKFTHNHYAIAPSINQTSMEREHMYASIYAYFHELLPYLTKKLNVLHQVNYSERYWRIVLGYWLYRYISVILQKYQRIENCNGCFSLTGVLTFDDSHYSLATADSLTFVYANNNATWSSVLLNKILHYSNKDTELQLEKYPLPEGESFFSCKQQKEKLSSNIWQKIIKKCLLLGNRLHSEKAALILNPYLARTKNIQLHLLLKQFPQFWSSTVVPTVAIDLSLRESLLEKNMAERPLKNCLYQCLFQMLPCCFLEGYNTLCATAEKTFWPKHARFALTANNFDTDEVFKAWIAARIGQTAYIVAQHGNNYGSLKYCYSEKECRATCDAFLSWGWRDEGDKKIRPLGIFKSHFKVPCYNKQGGLLLIQTHGPNNIDHWYTPYDHLNYLTEQFTFHKNLSSTIAAACLVRLAAAHKTMNWHEPQRWQQEISNVQLDNGETPLASLVSASCLVVHSYDSTGILETLANNIPTVCFWLRGLEDLNKTAITYYQQLIEAKILFSTAESAAEHINCIWHSIDDWWLAAKTQQARKNFCQNFARKDRKLVSTLKSTLLEVKTTQSCPLGNDGNNG